MNEEYIKKVIQIMDNMQSELGERGKCRFSEETRRLIGEVAEYCRKTTLYNHVKKKEPEFIRTKSAEYLYKHMIVKIARAPGLYHYLGAVIIMMPAIDDALKGGRVDDN